MGCGSSRGPETEQDIQAKKTSNAIEQEIKADKNKMKHQVKLLLLGSGEAGKSTFAKQMKILYMDGFAQQECLRQKPIIYCNIFDSCKKLIRAARRNFNLPVNEGMEEIFDYFEELDLTEDIAMTPELVEMVKKLWADSSIRQAYDKRSEFQLNDSTEYFFSRIDAVGQADYIPNQEDMLRLRNKTSGVIETCFKVKHLHFRMVDVGGQRNERRKWYHCFEDVTAVVFLVAMSEYDLFLEEDESTNRMKESVKLFADVINNDWFKNTPIMLFLNKEDLFAEKIKKTDLKVCFQSYTDGCNKEKGAAYIKKRFSECNKNPQRLLNVFYTCATDTESAKKVFNAVQEDIMHKVLAQHGL